MKVGGKGDEKHKIDNISKDTNSTLRKFNLKLSLITMFINLYESWGQALVAAYIVFLVLILRIRGFSLIALFWIFLLPGIYLGLFIDKIVHKLPLFDFLWNEFFPMILFVWSAILFIFLNNKTISLDFVKLLYLFSFIGLPVFFTLRYFKERFSKILQFYEQMLTDTRVKVVEGFVVGYILLIWIFGILYATIFYITNGHAFYFDTVNSPGLFDFFYFSFITSFSPVYSGLIVPSSIIVKILCFVETIVFLIIVGLFFANITNIRISER